MSINRRQFLKVGLSGMAYFTLEQTTPRWVMRAAQALPVSCLTNGRILVILQQSGGNDGLNTLIPRSDDAYYDAQFRPTIHIPKGLEKPLDAQNGLHPKMAALVDWFDRGHAAAFQCVGYANPDFSHFTSTDYWETGSAPGQLMPKSGWVARFFDNSCNGHGDIDPLFMASTGISSVPDMLNGSDTYVPPAISNSSKYRLTASADSNARLQAIHEINSLPVINTDVDFLQRSYNTVEASAQDIAQAAQLSVIAPKGYTTDSMGNGLKLASQIIRAGFDTRIFYVSQGGYDTHANQVTAADVVNSGDHQRLLGNFSQNIDSFLNEMEQTGNLDRVLVLTFSEFGRRVKENASFGTDHGAANVMFAFGGSLNAGIYGGQPELLDTQTIKGNLRHHLDFRSIYSAVIQDWFGAQAAPVFGQSVYDSIIANELPKLQFIRQASGVKNWQNYT